MPFGLPPNYTESFRIRGADDERYILLAAEAATRLGWNVEHAGNGSIIAGTRISWRSWGEIVTITVSQGVARLNSRCIGPQIVDWGKNEKNIYQLSQTIEDVYRTVTDEWLDEQRTKMHTHTRSNDDAVHVAATANSRGAVSWFPTNFTPRKGLFVVPALFALNIVVFIAMVASGVHILNPEEQDILSWGANYQPLTYAGEWWRIVTSCFIHIGVLHLLFNMYALMYVGMLLEPLIGSFRFATAYLLAGCVASMVSMWWNEAAISAGASGAIFGLFGVFFAVLTGGHVLRSTRQALLASVVFFVAYNLVTACDAASNIDTAAHIGGLIAGVAVGYMFVPPLRKPQSALRQRISAAAVFASFVLVLFVAYRTKPSDVGRMEEYLERFANNEKAASAVLQMPYIASDDILLQELRNTCVPNWRENTKLVDSCRALNVPKKMRTRLAILRRYSELNLQLYEVLITAIEQQSSTFETNIDELGAQIEALRMQLQQQH